MRDVGSPVPAKSTLESSNSPFRLQAPPDPIGSSSRQSARSPPPGPACPALIGWDGSRDLVLPIWEPLTQPHTQAQVRPRSPFPIPFPTPRALAETYRPGRCPSTGPASRASGPAPTWRRRSGRAGVGRRKGPFGRGGQGEGVGGAETLVSVAAASRRAERKPEGLQESPGCGSSRRRVRGSQQPPKATLVPSLSVGSWDGSNTG